LHLGLRGKLFALFPHLTFRFLCFLIAEILLNRVREENEKQEDINGDKEKPKGISIKYKSRMAETQ